MTEPRSDREQLADVVLSDVSLPDVVATVVAMAIRLVPRCDAAGIQFAGGHVQTAAGGPTGRLDAFQHETGEGPCADCISSGEATVVTLVATELRWPRFVALAREQGVRSCLALPVRLLDRQPFAALNLYSWSDGTLDRPDSRAQGAVVATTASVALANSSAHADDLAAARALSFRLRSPADIVVQAQGVLMQQEGWDAATSQRELEDRAARAAHDLDDAALEVLASVDTPPT